MWQYCGRGKIYAFGVAFWLVIDHEYRGREAICLIRTETCSPYMTLFDVGLPKARISVLRAYLLVLECSQIHWLRGLLNVVKL